MTSIKLKGGRELEAFLSAFPRKLQNGAVRAGLTAAAAVIRDEARLRAPKETEKLAAAIKSGSARVNRDGTVSIRVRVARSDDRGNDHAFLAFFMEYGVRPHMISAGGKSKRKSRLVIRAAGETEKGDGGALKIGEAFVTGPVHHPGFVAKPFLRPALDTKAVEAINAFGARVRKYMANKTALEAPFVEVDDGD